MKLKNIFITGTIILASAFAASKASAVPSIFFTNAVTIKLTAQVQSPTNTSGDVSTVAKPTALGITTTTLLSWIAQDEHAEANYSSTTFPTGAQLVFIVNSIGSSADFQVLDKSGNFLVDCSDLFDVSHGDIQVNSGTVTAGLFSPSVTQQRIFNFNYDDTFIGTGNPVNVTFETGGLETKVVADSKPKAGTYTETVKTTVSDVIGDGTFQGKSLVVTGTIGFSSKRNLISP